VKFESSTETATILLVGIWFLLIDGIKSGVSKGKKKVRKRGSGTRFRGGLRRKGSPMGNAVPKFFQTITQGGERRVGEKLSRGQVLQTKGRRIYLKTFNLSHRTEQTTPLARLHRRSS